MVFDKMFKIIFCHKGLGSVEVGLCPKLSCLFQEHRKGDRFQSRGPQYTVKAGTWSATQLIGGLIIDPYPSPSMSSDPRIFFQIARWPI